MNIYHLDQVIIHSRKRKDLVEKELLVEELQNRCLSFTVHWSDGLYKENGWLSRITIIGPNNLFFKRLRYHTDKFKPYIISRVEVAKDIIINLPFSDLECIVEKFNNGLVVNASGTSLPAVIDPMMDGTGTARFTDINSVNDGYRFESVADAMNRANTISWEYDYNDYPAHPDTLVNRKGGGPGSKLAEDQLNTIVCGQSVIGIEKDGNKKVFREIHAGNLDNRPYIMLSNDEKAPFTFDHKRSGAGFDTEKLFINQNIVKAAEKENAYIYAINCLSKPGLDSELFGECRAQGVAHVQSMILYNCETNQGTNQGTKASDKNIHCNSAGYGYGLSHQIGCASTAQDAVNVCRPGCQGAVRFFTKR